MAIRRFRARRLSPLLLASAFALSVFGAEAQSPTELAAQGAQVFADGDYRRAAELFEQAFAAKPNAAVKYNAALSWDRAGESARAADDYESALDLGNLDAERTRASQRRLAALQRALAHVTVTCPTGGRASVEGTHVTDLAIPAKFHLAPGRHDLTARTEGRAPLKRSIAVRSGEVVVVDLPCADGLEPRPDRDAPTPRATTSETPARDPEQAGSGTSPWLAFAAAGLFSGGALVSYVLFERANDDFDASDDTDADARSRAKTFRAFTYGAIGAAVVSAGIGVYLLVDRPTKQSAGSAVWVGVTPLSVSAAARF